MDVGPGMVMVFVALILLLFLILYNAVAHSTFIILLLGIFQPLFIDLML